MSGYDPLTQSEDSAFNSTADSEQLIGVMTPLGFARPRWTDSFSLWLDGDDFNLPMSRFDHRTLAPMFGRANSELARQRKGSGRSVHASRPIAGPKGKIAPKGPMTSPSQVFAEIRNRLFPPVDEILRRAPHSPRRRDLEKIADRPLVRQQIQNAWRKAAAQRRHHGFWIEPRADGSYLIGPVRVGGMDYIDPGTPPSRRHGAPIFVHTHEGYGTGPSVDDSSYARRTGTAGMVITENGVWYYGN